MKRAIMGSTLIVAYLLVPGQAAAQQGLFYGAAGNYSILSVENSDSNETGLGATGLIGYGLGMIAPYAKLVYGSISSDGDSDDGSYTLIQGEAGARVNFPQESFTPFVNGGLAYQRLSGDSGGETYTVSGSGFVFGAGILYFLGGTMALEAALNVLSGSFSNSEYAGQSRDIDISNTTYRVDLGVTVFTGPDGQE